MIPAINFVSKTIIKTATAAFIGHYVGRTIHILLDKESREDAKKAFPETVAKYDQITDDIFGLASKE